MADRTMGCVCVSAFVFSAAALFAAPAGAQVLGNSGDAVFGAERLFGVRNERFDVDGAANETEATTISIGAAGALLPENVPRLSFDYLAARKFSIGGAIGYSSTSFSDAANNPLSGGPDTKTFLLVGRAGFLHMFGRVLGIWPRGGFTYYSTSFDDADMDLSSIDLTIECMFPIVIAPHFGFLTGLSFDQSLNGTWERPGGDVDFDARSIALQFGLFGWI